MRRPTLPPALSPDATGRLTRRKALGTAALFAGPWLSACGAGSDADDAPDAADRESLGRAYEEERQASTRLDPGVVRLVDRGDGSPHLLLRGNLPVGDSGFEYEFLLATLRDATLKAGAAWPERVQIVDVSLLNEIADSRDLQIERRFWREHPHLGRFVHHPIFGALTDPTGLPRPIRRALERSGGLDRMDELLELLRALLREPVREGVALAVFVHCRRGATGRVKSSPPMGCAISGSPIATRSPTRIASRGAPFRASAAMACSGTPTSWRTAITSRPSDRSTDRRAARAAGARSAQRIATPRGSAVAAGRQRSSGASIQRWKGTAAMLLRAQAASSASGASASSMGAGLSARCS
ncbi:hypothetical protein Ddc_19874 [Ditylenchus destructor]|nr:hypothetical protein Ddc_19874 [Ditylenchus destructor]